MKHIVFLLLFVPSVLFSLVDRTAFAQETSPVTFRFYSTSGVSLEALSGGQAGEGVLVYYLARRGVEKPSMVVRLVKKQGTDVAIAQVYSALPVQDAVPVVIEGNRVHIGSQAELSLYIEALGGWWTRDGLANYNLDIQVYGPVYAMWGGNAWNQLIKPGQPNAMIQVRDPSSTHVPQWDLRLMSAEFPGRGYLRTNYAERKCPGDLQVDLGVSPLWPYVAASGAGYEQERSKLRPPIVVDWEKGRVAVFSELVTVRYQNCSYSFYALDKLEPGKLNRLNFEVPFAFYDLSGQGRGYPNLILRTQRVAAGTPWAYGGRDTQAVRYSWRNAIGDWQWDYKVEVLGFYPYGFDTPIADGLAQVDAPPYELFPQWVVERNWPLVTFIDTNGRSGASSEGIYDWSPLELGYGYVYGMSDLPDQNAFSDIREGLRGEYRLEKNLPPVLYLSPIDNRLHLLGAEAGLWNLGNGEILREQNLDGDLYIDSWTRERSARDAGSNSAQARFVEEALVALRGCFLYYGPQGIKLRRVEYPLSSLEILPPSDKTTWKTFQERLSPSLDQERDPQNMADWLNAYPGETLSILGGRFSGMRITDDGFRFVLDLEPGFRLASDLPIEGASPQEPGSYVLFYDDGRLAFRRATPPSLSLAGAGIELAATDAPKELETVDLHLTLVNTGLEDVHSLPITLTLAGPAGYTETLTQTVGLVPGEGQQDVSIPWAPARAGRWKIEAQFGGGPSLLPVGPVSTAVDVQPVQPLSFQQLVTLGAGRITEWARLGLFLAIVLVGATGVLLLALKRRLSEGE